MATASSAQREPSMEEILASIRRIIEDSDTGRKPAGEMDELRQDLELAPTPAPEPDVDAFRAELRGGLDVRTPATLAEVQAQLPAAEAVIARMETSVRSDPAPVALAPAAQPPTTLAEVSARVAAAPVPDANPEVPAIARISETSDTIVADWRRDIAAVGETIKAATSLSDAAAMRRAPAAAEPAAVAVPDAELAVEPTFGPASSRGGSPRPATAESPVRPAILSEHTGRQVAAAFGELSDAFASRSKKTFDEMAEEMLRPMLQDWLDNNLPTLVERLVREEIERVARGAQ